MGEIDLRLVLSEWPGPFSANCAATGGPPPSWRRVSTVESHAAGEPLRVVIDGLDPIPGATILEKRRFARDRVAGTRGAPLVDARGTAALERGVTSGRLPPRRRARRVLHRD